MQNYRSVPYVQFVLINNIVADHLQDSCQLQAAILDICEYNDLDCMCTSKMFSTYFAGCIAANCTVRDGLTTDKGIHTVCHAPVRDRSKALNGVQISGTIIALAAIILRLLARLRRFGGEGKLGIDDAVIAFSAVPSSPKQGICRKLLTCLGDHDRIYGSHYHRQVPHFIGAYIAE